MIDFSEFRRAFSKGDVPLKSENFPEDPFLLCKSWLQDVKSKQLLDGNAMVLSTASKSGIVSARTVLLKYFDSRGFIFFTNYQSQKGKDLKENAHAALTFYWPSLNRQLIAQGEVTKLPLEESKAYFNSRPRSNQLFTLASNQDQIIGSIDEVKQKARELDLEYQDQKLPYSDHWGGLILRPEAIEFWQGGEGRLNIRFKYKLLNGNWNFNQLSP